MLFRIWFSALACCYDMYEDLTETFMPYDDVMRIVKDSDYDGYIVSEYEEYNYGRSLEQIARHLKMLHKYTD